MLPLVFLALLLVSAPFSGAQPKNPDATNNVVMYWIDAEGGAATLIVSPSGESLLIDTGFDTDDRDAKRIFAAAQMAGLKRIDYLVISHYHRDHVGGLAALSKLIPIGKFYGRGDLIEPENQKWYDSFRNTAGANRTVVKPGDKIPIKGLDVMVVSSDQQLLTTTLKGGGPNPLCANALNKSAVAPENQRTVGVLMTYGKFKYLNLIDLDWSKEMELACPVNRLGTVTLYQTGRHGSFDGAGAPAFLGAIRPQVVVVNNGPRKGMGQVDKGLELIPPASGQIAPYEKTAYVRIAKNPGIEGIWQGHKSLLDPDPAHNTSPDMIANMEETAECKGNWIKASVARDGKFTMTNGRNGFSKSYMAR